MQDIISVNQISKTYAGGFSALKDINFSVRRGEIFALLGPNGAGKTTLISIICGIVRATSGSVIVDGFDSVRNFRLARSLIGLVPQELTTDAFETVWNTVSFSRGLFGKSKNPDLIEKILKDLSLWDKRNNKIMTLSGGMKRRMMIAKALSHEPKILFLDEPTAGVDVELRKDMWEQVHALRQAGVTIILTTHYIHEAEEMADRVGIINTGRIVLIEEKQKLMQQLGTKRLVLYLEKQVDLLPQSLVSQGLSLGDDKMSLIYSYDSNKSDNNIAEILMQLSNFNIRYKDLKTEQSSLEEIFVRLVNQNESSSSKSNIQI